MQMTRLYLTDGTVMHFEIDECSVLDNGTLELYRKNVLVAQFARGVWAYWIDAPMNGRGMPK